MKIIAKIVSERGEKKCERESLLGCFWEKLKLSCLCCKHKNERNVQKYCVLRCMKKREKERERETDRQRQRQREREKK